MLLERGAGLQELQGLRGRGRRGGDEAAQDFFRLGLAVLGEEELREGLSGLGRAAGGVLPQHGLHLFPEAVLAEELQGFAAQGIDIGLALRAAALAHREAGLMGVTGEHYEGGHWLGTFAVYLLTGRGLAGGERPGLHQGEHE